MFESMAEALPAILGAVVAIVFVGASYFIITLDRQRATSPSKDDTQVGIKLVIFGLVLAGIQLVSGGVTMLLSFMLSGFKGGSIPIKIALPPIIVGGLTILVMAKALLPRTNAASAKQPERYMLGALGIQYGVMTLISLSSAVSGLFLDMPWARNSGNIASLLTSGAIALLSIRRFGGLSGWTMPVAPPPQQQQPPQQGYPPQGGGYPPQGGGYPPQGGGYPPQGGGYPPQGGGYPPQGGGGYPPR